MRRNVDAEEQRDRTDGLRVPAYGWEWDIILGEDSKAPASKHVILLICCNFHVASRSFVHFLPLQSSKHSLLDRNKSFGIGLDDIFKFFKDFCSVQYFKFNRIHVGLSSIEQQAGDFVDEQLYWNDSERQSNDLAELIFIHYRRCFHLDKVPISATCSMH